jgi:chromosome partitioning protein
MMKRGPAEAAMAVTVAVLNPKGGVGKTTLTLLLAGEFQRLGYRTAVLDTDPRANVLRWVQLLQSSGKTPPFEVASVRGRDAAATISALAASSQALLIDGAGQEDDLNELTVAKADLTLAPFQVSQQDIIGVLTMAQFVSRLAARLGRPCPLLGVMNRVSLMTMKGAAYAQVRGLLDRQGVQVAAIELKDRQAFNRMTGTEASLYAFERETPGILEAQKNAQALFAEIVAHLNRLKAAA